MTNFNFPIDSRDINQIAKVNSPSPTPQKKMRGRRISQIAKSSSREIYPQPLPPLPLAKIELVHENHPSETNKVIKKELAVKVNKEEYNFGTEEAKTIATLDLAIDYQTMQFAYFVNELTDLHLSDANLTRFMESLDLASIRLLEEMQIDPEVLKKATNQGSYKNPMFLDAYGMPDMAGQREMDRVFYGMVHAAQQRGKSLYCKSKGLDFIKSGTARATEGGQSTTPSVLINARYQSFNGKAKAEIARLGSFYDLKDPGNTVKELEDYLYNPGTDRLNMEIKNREKEIKSLDSDQKKDAIKNSLIPLYAIKNFKENSRSELEAVRLIEEKKRSIDDQMVQLILFQVSQNLDSLEGDTFYLSFEGLLNELKTKKQHVIDPSGLIMDEGNNLQEMQGAFERFQGKELIFDRTGPYLDKEGNIHLPYELKQQKSMTLEPLLLNLTVNGSIVNNPFQAKINQESLLKLTEKIEGLKEEHPELSKQLGEIQRKINGVRIKLSQGNSTFEMASDLLAAQLALRSLMKEHRLGCFALSLGCYSGKDRTAIVLELALLKFAIDPELEKMPEKTRNQIREKLIQLIIDPEGMSAEISFENTGTRVIKYMEVFLPGQQKTISNLAKASFYKMDQAKVLLNPPILE